MVPILKTLSIALLFGLFRYGFKKYSNIHGKLNESLVKLLYYFTAYTLSQFAIREVDIWPNIFNCWEGIITGQNNSSFVLFYYIFELAWYISETFCLFLLDSVKSDRKQMVVHHLVTIGLLATSYNYGYQRIGLLVLSCHNINDIFLEGGKSFKYLGFKTMSNVTFVGLILSWIYSRLYVFIYYILHSTIVSVYFIAMSDVNLMIGYYISNILLLILLCLNIVWFFMICRIAINAYKHGEPEDEREIEETDFVDTNIYDDIGVDSKEE